MHAGCGHPCEMRAWEDRRGILPHSWIKADTGFVALRIDGPRGDVIVAIWKSQESLFTTSTVRRKRTTLVLPPLPSTMKALYPTSHNIPALSDAALALKIARHSPCSICTSEICPGLRPPPIVQLVPDSDDDYDGSESYLSSCACGHDVTDHGADLSVISRNEFERRGRIAVRIDQLLQVSLR
jgi:hypothetical protein